MSIILKSLGRNYITKEEWDQLTMWQKEVLACVRHYGTVQQASKHLGRDQKTVGMVLLRIRQKGINR